MPLWDQYRRFSNPIRAASFTALFLPEACPYLTLHHGTDVPLGPVQTGVLLPGGKFSLIDQLVEIPEHSERICSTTFEHNGVRISHRTSVLDDLLRVECECHPYDTSASILPFLLAVGPNDGRLLLPGEKLPFDPADKRAGSRSIPLADREAAWALGSQAGWLARVVDGTRPDSIRIQRVDEANWLVGPEYRIFEPNSSIRATIEWRPAFFSGALNVGQLQRHLDGRQSTPRRSTPSAVRQVEKPLMPEGECRLSLDGLEVSVTIRAEGDMLESSPLGSGLITAMKFDLAGEDVWQVTLRAHLQQYVERVRLEATVSTPCGNPTWDGDATVFIPGNFARCNYHPGHLHGGGPKWGPSPTPVREPLTANDDAPGCCHGWTFAASRLPQVWAAAVDRRARKMVWIGAEPRSPLGENCAGFVSPEGETTTLKLATPTTYEPWVPLGYSRMRPEARRDMAQVGPGDAIEWTFFVAVRETDDLNAWAPLERALYLRNRPMEPTPVKLTLDEAARICASAIHDRFYDRERGVITYSTGPQGRQTIVGFTGMAHSALMMLWAGQEFGNAEWEDAGRRILGTVSRMFLEGPEFPWTAVPGDKKAGEPGSFVHGSGEPGYVVMVAFDNLAEAYCREQSRGREMPEWREALKKCADAWLRNQSPEGAYPLWGPGFAADFKENEYGSTNVEAGVIANMIDAHAIFGDAKYLESARRAAAFYGRQLDNGQLWGGPGDIRALVNSEVPMFFLRGFRRLYEITRDGEHLRLLLAAAAWRYSFQFAHSWLCEPGSPLFKQGWAGLGSENASACNLHSVAFGCINVPDMWALRQLTGDDYHRLRCEDLARYSTQQYARFAGDLGFPFAGAGTESWWTSDSVWGKGHPWIFTDPGFDLGYMSWVTGWSGYGALHARAIGLQL